MAKSARGRSSTATKKYDSFDNAYPEVERAAQEAYAAIAEQYREATDSLQALVEAPAPRKPAEEGDQQQGQEQR